MSQINDISIIVPTIGSGPIEYLIEALESANSISNCSLLKEVIIIDNSNSTKLNSILAQYTLNKPKFRHVIENNKMTMAECWNYGLDQTASNWILYLHDDDIINTDVFKEIDLNLLKNDVGYIAFDFQKLSNNRASYISIESGVRGAIKNTPKFISTLYNAKKLRKIGGWDEQGGYALDLLALIKLSHLFGDHKVDRALGKYRIHEQNASSLDKRSKAYGDSIPYIFTEVFSMIDDLDIRKLLAFHLFTFTYPNQTVFQKGINWILRKFGFNAWII